MACSSSTGAPWRTCSTSSPSRASSTRWRCDANMDPIEFRIERMGATPKARSASRPWRRCATGRPRVRMGARDRTVDLASARAHSAPAWSEISLNRQTGKIKVHKVWVAVDGGTIVTAGAGQGQYRERDHLRALQRAARTRHAEGRRRGAEELPRLQPDAHVRPAGGDPRPVRRRRHAADGLWRDRQSVHCAARSPTPSTGSPASGCDTCRSRRSACWRH